MIAPCPLIRFGSGMLKKIRGKNAAVKGVRVAIVAAKYNPEFTNALVRFAKAELKGNAVKVIRVPGAFETPVIAARLARSGDFDAVICFGAILRGATTHADHIAVGVTNALAQLAADTGVPIIHGVLLFEDREQAKARCLNRETSRGIEAARTALEMAAVVRSL